MCGSGEESVCEISKGESQKIRSEGDSNHRKAKSGKELGCTCSAKGSERIRGPNEPVHEYEDAEDLFG